MKIGLLGGTFNPIHIGHLILAQECWYQLNLDKVIFIPAGMPPHKDVEGHVTAADRLNMVRLTLEGDHRFEISTYEIDKGDTSYSIDTIKHLRDKYGETAEFFFLTGADSEESLSMWKDSDDILRLTTFVIANRPGWDKDSTQGGNIQRITIPGIEISSTMIRDRIKNHKPIDFFLPPHIVNYIRNKGLYAG